MSKSNLKKKDLVKNLSFNTGFSFNYSKKIVNDFIDILIENITKGNFKLKNVGSFKIIYKKERIGRNPKTKEKHIITARKSISFLSSKNISEKLNQLI
tara:strand:- start:402 stop:695 length:294 start_codon:yes stop_codon:yes gene_type:complete